MVDETRDTRKYGERAKEIVGIARQQDKIDTKYWVTPDQFRDLVGAGARVINLNREQAGENYYHEVRYNHFTFSSATESKLVLEIQATFL